MNRIRAAALRNFKNFCDVEIRLRRSCSADGVSLVGHQNVQRGAVHVGKDGNRRNTQLAAGTNHPHRDLPPIGDKNLLEHELNVGASAPLVLQRHRPKRLFGYFLFRPSRASHVSRLTRGLRPRASLFRRFAAACDG